MVENNDETIQSFYDLITCESVKDFNLTDLQLTKINLNLTVPKCILIGLTKASEQLNLTQEANAKLLSSYLEYLLAVGLKASIDTITNKYNSQNKGK